MRGMQPEELCRALDLMDSLEVISIGWDLSEESIPADCPDFLNPEYVKQTCCELGMHDDMSGAVVRAAQMMAADKYVKRLAWHAYWLAFGADRSRGSFSRWPTFSGSSNERTGIPGNLFYVAVSLGAVNKVREAHARRGIPREVASSMLDRIVGIIDNYKKTHGEYGLAVASFNYFIIFFNGELFHLGRLQLHYNPFRGRIRVYRHMQNDTVIALSEPDVAYRADGEFYIESRGDSPDGMWTSIFHETEEIVQGHPVIPRGKCLPHTITLDKSRWECVLQPKDDILQIHIPGRSKLDFDECGTSLEEAHLFFTRYFPERSYKAFVISSWLMDDLLEHMLPPESNLLRFQKEMYRFPSTGTTESALRWIFGSVPKDLTKAPRDTTLRRKVIDHVLAGGNMVGGGSFILRDDFDWGSERYRRQRLGDFRGWVEVAAQ